MIVPATELAVPALRGLKVLQLAEALGLGPNLLLSGDGALLDFGVEGELHFCIGRAPPAFLPLAAVFLPTQEIAPRDAVPVRNFLGVDAV